MFVFYWTYAINYAFDYIRVLILICKNEIQINTLVIVIH